MEFPGCYSSLPPTVDLVPRSRTIPGGRGRGGSDDDEELNTTNKELDSMSNDELQQHQQRTLLHADDELLTRNFRRETTTSEDEAIETSRGGTTIQTDDQIEAFSLEVARIPGKRTEVKGQPRG